LDNLLFVSCRDLTEYGHIGRPHYFIQHLSRHHKIIVFNHPQYWKRRFRKRSDEYKKYFRENILVTDGYPMNLHDAYVNEVINIPPNIIRLREIISRYDIDLVLNYSNIVLGAFYQLWGKDRPLIFDFADYFPEMVGTPYQSKLGLKRIASKTVKFLMDTCLRKSDLVTCCSNMLCRYAKSIGAKNVELISNGVSNDFSRLQGKRIREIFGFKESDVVLGFVGNIRENVRLELGIRAIPLLKEKNINAKMLVVGDGPCLKELKEWTTKIGLSEEIVFTGHIPRDQIYDYIDAMDICLLPFKIGMRTDVLRPLVLFEYLACGKPVIATSILEVKKMFPEEKNQFIKYADDLKTFVKKLEELILRMRHLDDMNDELKKISEKIREDFSWEVLAKKFHDSLNKVIL